MFDIEEQLRGDYENYKFSITNSKILALQEKKNFYKKDSITSFKKNPSYFYFLSILHSQLDNHCQLPHIDNHTYLDHKTWKL